jgi:hypothetical protein
MNSSIKNWRWPTSSMLSFQTLRHTGMARCQEITVIPRLNCCGRPSRAGSPKLAIHSTRTILWTFAFDNETPRHRVYLEPFQIANRVDQ